MVDGAAVKAIRVSANVASLKDTRVRDYAVRFVLGGAATVGAGLIAKHWGPVVGGLFLAFPAIFPAGATLLEEHEVQKKAKIGKDGHGRGREAVALDALGAALGAIGLAAFALVLWRMLPRYGGWVSLGLAVVAWAVVAGVLWVLRKRS